MIDTIKINYYSNSYIDLENFNTDILTNCKETLNKKTGKKYLTGKFDNFNVYITNSYINIEGSLSKFVNANNYEPLKLSEIPNAINKLNDSFKLDFGKAKINKIHTGLNIETDFGINAISEKYLDLPYFKKLPLIDFSEIVYKNKKNQFVIYDKKNELLENQNIDLDTSNNLLRFEARYDRKLYETFSNETKNSIIVFNDLKSLGFNKILLNKFMNTHQRINKINTGDNLSLSNIFNKDNYTSKDFFETYLMLMLIKDNEIDNMNNFIKELKHQGKIKNIEYNRFRTFVKNKLKNINADTNKNICLEIENKLNLKIKDYKDINNII